MLAELTPGTTSVPASQVELRQLTSRDGEVPLLLRQAAPIVVNAHGRYWLVPAVRGNWVLLRDPQGRTRRTPLASFAEMLRLSPETQQANLVRGATMHNAAQLTDKLQPIFQRQTQRAVSVLTRWRAQDDSFRISVGWTLAPAAATAASLQRTLGAGVARMALVRSTFLGFWILSWLLLSQAVQQVDTQSMQLIWVSAFASALLLLPLSSWLQQRMAMAVGLQSRRLLLRAALSLRRGEVGQLGLGELIARALETGTMDTKASTAAVGLVFAALDLVVVLVLTLLSGGRLPMLLLIAVAVVFVGLQLTALWRVHQQWYPAKQQMTALQTEEMVGHRARKALQQRRHWFAAQDGLLNNYQKLSQRLDKRLLVLELAPKLWLLLGLGLLVGLVFLDQQALLYGDNLLLLAVVIIGTTAWQGLAEAALPAMDFCQLVQGGSYRVETDAEIKPVATSQHQPLALAGDLPLHVSGLAFSYPQAKRPIFRDLNFYLEPGSRTVLTGPSGGGKSTLGALLSGRLAPTTGAVLSGGVDVHVLGRQGWHGQVAYIPQAHTNHIVSETFAFNLLLGSHWPPAPQAMAKAAELAVALGLGPLLATMPAGMNQVVGDNGWRLSAGERSRVFLARGLLQDPNLLVIDEVLAPLDPDTAHRVLDVIERQGRKILLIAHE